MFERLRAFLLGYPFYRTVIVTTKTDRAFRGVLWGRAGDNYVLKNAERLRSRLEVDAVYGDVLIDRANVDFIQVTGPVEPPH